MAGPEKEWHEQPKKWHEYYKIKEIALTSFMLMSTFTFAWQWVDSRYAETEDVLVLIEEINSLQAKDTCILSTIIIGITTTTLAEKKDAVLESKISEFVKLQSKENPTHDELVRIYKLEGEITGLQEFIQLLETEEAEATSDC